MHWSVSSYHMQSILDFSLRNTTVVHARLLSTFLSINLITRKEDYNNDLVMPLTSQSASWVSIYTPNKVKKKKSGSSLIGTVYTLCIE